MKYFLILLVVMVGGCTDGNFYDRLYEREPYQSHQRQMLEEMERSLIERRMQEQSDIIIGRHRWSPVFQFDYEKPNY